MDIRIINEVITSLENDETTQDNIQELASLYIVREYIMPENIKNTTETELLDLLPHYRSYCDTKRRYQLGEITEEPVVKSVQSLCKEIDEFISSLYSNTDMRKERVEIAKTLDNLREKII